MSNASEEVDKAIMHGMATMAKHRSGVEAVDNFVDFALMSTGNMSKTLIAAKEMGLPQRDITSYTMIIRAWEAMVGSTVDLITAGTQ